MPGLTRPWQDWIARYVGFTGYWYVLKGKSIGDRCRIRWKCPRTATLSRVKTILFLARARDRDGTFTVIELKKDKTDDEVFGQLSRYLGWCRKTRARSGNVRGIIVARRIGPKLWAAADGHDSPVGLMEYDLRMSLAPATRG